uniref:Leucine-rich repeat-containing protein 6 n=1 Tax=Eptatretus burgeri TaxID=7764 RepID=A0A8C4QX16_EPTBU
MVRITEELVRSRAEHNEGEIFSLEELSLHQQQIERLECIGNWCLNLRILYLQNNLVPRIENINKLKKLQYLNLALNNIERIENLQGCEDLRKLDLTLNFVGELTSVQSLCHSLHLEELYLVGNPCALFDGYRAFVIATLLRLKVLDGQVIERSERIRALQDIERVTAKVEEQEREHKKQRERERTEGEKRKKDREHKKANTEKQRETNNREKTQAVYQHNTLSRPGDEERKFWSEETEFTPESRLEAHNFIEERRKTQRTSREQQKIGKDHARSLIFQLVLPDEVSPDSSVARRSQTTGHLEVTMPRHSPPTPLSLPRCVCVCVCVCVCLSRTLPPVVNSNVW